MFVAAARLCSSSSSSSDRLSASRQSGEAWLTGVTGKFSRSSSSCNTQQHGQAYFTLPAQQQASGVTILRPYLFASSTRSASLQAVHMYHAYTQIVMKAVSRAAAAAQAAVLHAGDTIGVCCAPSPTTRKSLRTCFCCVLPDCSGHNSYLEGNQLTSSAGTATIESGLRLGCRVIELDVYDGPNGQPICTHGGTLTRYLAWVDLGLSF